MGMLNITACASIEFVPTTEGITLLAVGLGDVTFRDDV